jgi:PPP family 3-phenylpropionic acid transporter
MRSVPYFRLSGFYLFYFASLGALVPFWSLYLEFLGFSKVEIGQLVAALMAPKIFAPYIWGWFADHSQKRISIIGYASLGAVLSYSLALWLTGYVELALISSVFGFFWHAALPQFEAVTMDHLGEDAHHYSRIRVWGSIGFILMAMGLPAILDGEHIAYLPYVVLAALVLIFLMTVGMRDFPREELGEHLSVKNTLKRPDVMALLVACFLQLVSHGPYYTFFTIYVQDYGYSLDLAGQLWALGVFAEVILFLWMHRLLVRFTAANLLQLSILLTALRWMLTAMFVDSLPVLLFSQLLHAASYGLFHASAIHMIYSMFPGRLQGRGQALYASFSFGLGGAVGALFSGYAWESWGASWSFGLAAMVSLLALVIAHLGLRRA